MPKARVLKPAELRRVLDYTATRPHALRNRAILLLTHWAGMRIGEVANLRLGDILARTGDIRPEFPLLAAQTKSRRPRTVYLNAKLRRELAAYVANLAPQHGHELPLFMTQKRTGFSPNSLCQAVNGIYRRAGMDGATSHSGRRSLITSLAQKGVGVRVLAEIAGHRDIRVTQAYIDVNGAMMRAAIEMVA